MTNLQAIDLHYHAGIERQPGKNLRDYVQHAWDTGRRYQGITDHVDIYTDPRFHERSCPAYGAGFDGMRQLYAEFAEMRERFPGMRLYFAPEYHTDYYPDRPTRYPLDEAPDELFEMADYLICDVNLNAFVPLGLSAQTEAAVRTVRDIGALAARSGRPAYLAHPMRYVIDRTISWKGPDPATAALAVTAAETADPVDLARLFQVDLVALGRASREYGVPLEINGMSQWRLREFCPAAYPAYLHAYALMAAEGATFVPGSDQHELDRFHHADGWFQPFDTLGLAPLDTSFLQRVGIQVN